MSYTTLDKIISHKKNWISKQKNEIPICILKSQVKISTRQFYSTLFNNRNKSKPLFILEYKKASPSKGIIFNNPDPIKIANIYKNYSTVISVVTDTQYFHGSFHTLTQISNTVTQPILCKDFFISKWQIYFARLHQADAILLMLSIINDDTYNKFSYIAHSLNMGVLTEITNENELKRAIYLNAKVIGINNRNLHDLSINLNRSINLSKNIPDSIIKISESGITQYQHIKKLKNYVHGFLIGTILMSSANKLQTTINKLMFGENKICGITRPEDAHISYISGSVYIGLIFVKHSPRYINTTIAYNIISVNQNLNYVGVFHNATIDYIINTAKILNLYAVQLHGTEDQIYINKLRMKLPDTCQIWKSVNMNEKPFLFICNLLNVDRYLLDNKEGGSGKKFNWSNLSYINLNKSILAGGLTVNNCEAASNLGCLGLDFNSGIEIKPGIKNHQKIKKIFKILKNF